MEYIAAILFLSCLILLPVGLIYPPLIKKLFRRELSRKAIAAIFGGGIIMSIMVIGSSPKKESQPSSTSESVKQEISPTNTPTPTSKPTQYELKAEVRFSETAFKITNEDDKDWTGCKLELNAGILRGGYVYKTNLIPSNDPLIIPFREFTKSDGTRFNSYEIKPQSLSISCEVGDVHGFGYYGVN